MLKRTPARLKNFDAIFYCSKEYPLFLSSRPHRNRTSRRDDLPIPAIADQWISPRCASPYPAEFSGSPAWGRAAAYSH